MAIIDHAQNRNHKQRATEVYQQDTAPGRRGAPQALDSRQRSQAHPPRPPPPQPRKGQGQQVIRGIFRTQPNNFDGALSKIAKKLLTTFAPSMMLNPALNMPMVMILREALSLTGSKCRHELIHH